MIINKKSFTFVEIMTIATIIVVLATGVLITIKSSVIKSRDIRRQADLKNLYNLLELYYYDNHYFPAWASGCIENITDSANPFRPGAGVVPQYSTHLPSDPLYGKGYCYYYKTKTGETQPQNYHLIARMEKDTEKALNDGGRYGDFYEVFASGGQALAEVNTASADIKTAMGLPVTSASWIVEGETDSEGKTGFNTGNYDLNQTGNTAYNTTGGYNPASGAVELAQEEYYTDAELPSQTNLVGYWRMNTTYQTNTVVDSKGTNTGTINLGTLGNTSLTNAWKTGTNCKFGNCLSFDGSDDYVNVLDSNSLDVTTQFTLVAWIYMKGAGAGDNPILTKYYRGGSGSTPPVDSTFGFDDNANSRRIRLFVAGQNAPTPDISHIGNTIMNYNQWYFVVAVYNGTAGTMDVYLNAVKDVATKTSGVPSSVDVNAEPVLIGAHKSWGNPTPTYFLNGTIDEVAIYNRDLSASEIALLYRKRAGYYQSEVYNAEATAKWKTLSWLDNYYWPNYTMNIGESLQSGNVLYMKLNNNSALGEGATNKTADESGYGNDGTCYNIANEVFSVQNCPWVTGGKLGGGINFDGTTTYPGNGDSINFNYPSLLTIANNNFTVAGWFYHRNYAYPLSTVVIGHIAASGRYWGLGHGYQATGIVVEYSDGTTTIYQILAFNAGSQPPQWLNNWVHLTFVFNRGGVVEAYYNGIRQANTVNISTVTGNMDMTSVLRIGEKNGWKLNGIIDEVAVWSRALSESEIQELYRRGTTRLKLQARSCSDSTCSTNPSWSSDLITNTSNDISTLLSASQFIQFKALFEADNSLSTPTFHISNATPYLKKVQVDFEK